MKMPSVKFYHQRARVFGALLVISVICYFVIRFMVAIFR